MEKLFEKYIQKLQTVSTEFTRSIIHEINWNARLIGIKGARGIGKTTLLLQYIKLNHSNELEKTLYISLDSIWFSNNSLVELVDEFIKKGGKYLFIDEVHKYPIGLKKSKTFMMIIPN
jgi:predicted AAA+ superfamily ATPase